MATPSKKLWFCAAGLLVFVSLSSSFSRCLPAVDAPANDEQSLKKLSLEQLGNIEVTTMTKEPEAVWKTPAAIYVITQDDIERSGATNIAEALRLAPGVEVARIDGDTWAIGVRGFGSRLSRSVLVLIDGRSVYSTFLAGVYWEVQNTMLEDIDRIEVIRGPGGTIWGPNAVNGVINIITKNSKETQGLLVSAGGGNVEHGFANARYGGGNGSNFTYRFYGQGFARGPEYHPDGRNFDSWSGGQGGFRADWKKSDRDTFRFSGDLYYQADGESVTATTYNPPASNILDGYAHLSGGNVLFRWDRNQGEGKNLQVEAYYDRTNRHELNFGDLRDTYDVDFLQRLPWGSRQQISWGLGVRLSYGNEVQVVSGLTFNPSMRTDQLYTAFIQDEIALVPKRLALFAGTKLLKTNYTGVEPEPSVRLLYTPTSTQTLWAAYTHALRTPADVERDFFLSGLIKILPNGLPYFARFNANRNFQSEQLNGYEAGYRRLLTTNFYVDIAGFFNQYYDLFSEDIIGAPFLENEPAPPHLLLPAQFGNGLQGTTEGVELAPEWKVTNYWRLRGSYSFLEMHIKKGPGSLDIGTAPTIQGSSPQHQVQLQSDFDLPKALTVDLQFRYVSALTALQVPAYTTGDASLAWQANKHVRFSVVGQNLFQPQHPEFSADPRGLVGIRRGVYGKVVFTR